MADYERKPVLVTADELDRGERFRTIPIRDFFSQPTSWLGQSSFVYAACVEGRLAAATSGPVLLDVTSPRFEKVGWPRAPEKATDDELLAIGGASWPNANKVQALSLGEGSLKPQLVIVTKATRLTTIFRALHFKGYDELGWFLIKLPKVEKQGVNYIRRIQSLFEAFETKPKWIAFGKNASEVLGNAQIEQIQAKHPDDSSVTSYQDIGKDLGRNGLDNGPWRNTALPTVVVSKMPEIFGSLGVREKIVNKTKLVKHEDEARLYLDPKKSVPVSPFHMDLLREASSAKCTPEEFGEVIDVLKQKAMSGDLKAIEILIKFKLTYHTDQSKAAQHNTQVNVAIMESESIRQNLADPKKAKAAYDLMNLIMPPSGGAPPGRTFDATPLPKEE